MSSLAALQDEWNTLYKKTLPSLARSKDAAQSSWPVVLDHCFARIILDNAVGKTAPWTEVLKSPAYKNMSEEQLRDAIALGEKIKDGQAGLTDLDEKSLSLRGKGSKVDRRKGQGEQTKAQAYENKSRIDGRISNIEAEGPKQQASPGRKRKRSAEGGDVSKYFLPSPPRQHEEKPNGAHGSEPADHETQPARKGKKQQSKVPDDGTASELLKNPLSHQSYADKEPLVLVEESTMTPFRKQVLSLLTQVPRGKYTTYQAMSDHISATSHKTCARAIGSAMRNNPFAPVVPCHRVLANDGKIGGFGGHWGDDGKYADKKRRMLRDEGVKFDGTGKVVGGPWRGFK